MEGFLKFWRLITPRERRGGIVLFLLMFVGMALETLGVGLVIPVLTVITRTDLATRYPASVPWLARLGNPTHAQLVVGFMLGMVVVYAVKSLFLALLAARQWSYTAGIQTHLSQRLFDGYIRQPYVFHLHRNSAELNRNVSEVSMFVSSLSSGLTLLTELLVMLGITALLLSVEPLGALLVGPTIGLAGWGFYRFTKTHVKRWGEERQYHEGFRIKHLMQGFGSVKDVKVLGREEGFVTEFAIHNAASIRIAARQQLLLQLPRLLLELLTVLAPAILVVVVVMRGKSLDTVLPIIAVFGVAAFRIMPSVNRILNAYQTMKYSWAVIDTLESEFRILAKTPPQVAGPPVHFKSCISLQDVTFRYPGAERNAVEGISIDIDRGSSVGIIGGSGAGKSTLVDIILGLLSPDEGRVVVDGTDILANIYGWTHNIGYVPQAMFLTDDSLLRNVAFGLPNEKIDRTAVMRAVAAAQLEPLVASLPQGLDTIIGERGVRLSGGQRQRIGIARALYHDPDVLVMDEATSSLDGPTEREVMNAIKSLRGTKTVIIVAHRLSTVEDCNVIYRLQEGKVAAHGAASEVLGGRAVALR